MPKKIINFLIFVIIVTAIAFRIYLAKSRPMGADFVTASSNWSADFVGEKAFDGDETTYWQSSSQSSDGEWLQIHYSQPRLVDYLSSKGYVAYAPKNFKLLASNDGKDWRLLYEGENQDAMSNWQTFKFNNQNYFSDYKLEIASSYAPPILAIFEVKLGNDIGQFKLGLLKIKKTFVDLKNSIIKK
jgi:hypothetical protein